MGRFLCACYLVGIVFAWHVEAGWMLADGPHSFPNPYRSEGCRQWVGMDMSVAGVESLLWPVSLPVAYLFTGGAEHGWVLPRFSFCGALK